MGQDVVMAHHTLEPLPGQVVDAFSSDVTPAARITSGDRLTVRTLDASGHLEPWRRLGQDRRQMFPSGRGHCLAGPIEVADAEPGQYLAVGVTGLRPADWGYTIAGIHDDVLNRRIGTTGSEPGFLSWEIDAVAGTARNQYGFRVPTAPFLGVVGTAPAEPGEHSTIPPRTRAGGNIDCRELTAGSTLYLPVNVPGAYLFIGDGHAAQGDGEVGGTAIECGMTTELTVAVVDDVPVDAVHAITPTSRITFGFSDDLNAATGDALDGMLTWLQRLLDLDRTTALAYASVAVDLRVTQVANTTWGVHAVLPVRLVP
jgi:acetamidase/formamidase